MRVPSFTPGLIFTVYVFSRRSRPEPLHFEHGCSITVPLPRQRGHGCDSANSPWLSAFTPRPLHSGQITGVVPGSAPVPPHWPQAVVSSTGTFASTPCSESSNDRCTSASMSAPRCGCARPAPRPPRPPAEEAAEQVGEIADVEAAEVDVRPARRTADAAVRRAEGVVLLALLRVGQHVVRVLHLLEALLGVLVARVRVGVVLARELPVRLLDLVLRGVLRNPERRRRACQPSASGAGGCGGAAATTTRAGRTTRSPSV